MSAKPVRCASVQDGGGAPCLPSPCGVRVHRTGEEYHVCLARVDGAAWGKKEYHVCRARVDGAAWGKKGYRVCLACDHDLRAR